MITPLDIEKKAFGKSVRGYNTEEVDTFLDEIMLDYEKLIEENKRLNKDLENINKELLEYKKSENSVLNTLESAKHLMSDISASAEKRAEIILKNARLDAEVIQREAKDSIEKWSEEGESLKKQVAAFRLRYKQLLTEQITVMEGSTSALIKDLEEEFVPASMTSNDSKFPKDTILHNSDNNEVKNSNEEKRAAIDIIMEDMKKSPADNDKKTRLVNIKDDMTKTRIL